MLLKISLFAAYGGGKKKGIQLVLQATSDIERDQSPGVSPPMEETIVPMLQNAKSNCLYLSSVYANTYFLETICVLLELTVVST